MNFVSWARFYRDIAAWERQLPHFDAVVGVPRSGMIPAAYIALRRNIRLVELYNLLRSPRGAIERAPMRDTNPVIRHNKPFGNKVLIVDDSSSNQSVTFNGLRHQLREQTALDISFGAVYRASKRSNVDFFYRQLPLPRIFEWNWFRHWQLRQGLLDMDGVLCEDWHGHEEAAEDPAYLLHIRTVAPLYLPDVPLRGIVTSRLERHREATEQWLHRHGVAYDQLIMHPAATPEERRRRGDHGARKAEAYQADPQASLFVESSVRQAEEIHRRTRRPVLCIDAMTMYSSSSK